jgi:hypothetical protein
MEISMQLANTNRQGFAPATLTEAVQFSEMLASSSMVPRAYQGKPQDVLVCVQWGYEMGLAPMQALQNIAVINGKPSVYGDAAMALVQASPVCEDVEEYFEDEGTPNPVAVCVAKRKGRKPVTARFSVEDAKRAGLWGKQGPWSAYPKRMMQMRARGFALRDAFPDVLKGMITAEEAQDYPSDVYRNAPVNTIQTKPANPLDAIAPPQPITEPLQIEEAMADTVDSDADTVAQETVTVVDAPLPTEVVADGLALLSSSGESISVHAGLEEWQDAYEDMADRIARAGKREPRERMTILKEFKQANEETLAKVDTVKRVRHTAAYSKRIKALGAAQA